MRCGDGVQGVGLGDECWVFVRSFSEAYYSDNAIRIYKEVLRKVVRLFPEQDLTKVSL